MKASNLKRRQAILALGISSIAFALPMSTPLLAQSSGLESSTLAPGITLIQGAGASVVVAEGDDSVVVIDGGLHEHAEALLAEIRRVSNDKPISVLFNTNWRPEHTGLNHLLGPEGVSIMAHENTRLWQTASFHVEWEDRQYEPMPVAAQANDSFYKSGSLTVGSDVLSYHYTAQAHTDGDIFLHFEDANILVAGDLLGVSHYPVMDWETGGWVGGLQEATNAMLAVVDDETTIVTASGELGSKSDLEAQAELLNKAREAVANAFRSGQSLKDFKATEPAKEIGPLRSEPEAFIEQLYHGAWAHVRELGRII